METTHNEIFETLAVPKAIAKLALPTMLGMLVTVIYNLADTFFVGQLNDANQVAAVTLTTPVFMWFMALGSIFGIGGGSYISRLLGQKQFDKCKTTCSVAFYLAIVVGVICMTLGIIFIDPLLSLIGANNATWEFTKSYLVIFIAGAPFVIVSFVFGQIIRAEGAAKQAMIGMMIGTILNIILDPLFIITFKLDVAGAAYATVIANIVTVLYYIRYCLKESPYLSVLPKHFKISRDILKNIFPIGIPASLNGLLFGTSALVLNNVAKSYGNSVIAAIGIVSKATMFPAMLLIGLCVGIQPLIGYNYAAGNHKRLTDVIKTTLIFGTIFGIITTIMLVFLSPYIVSAFLDDAEVISLGTRILNINTLSIPFLCTLFLMTNIFQALGKALPSMILSISRQGLIFIPVVVIANNLIGLNGIIWAQPISDILSSIIAVLLYIKTCCKDIEVNHPRTTK